RARVVANGAAGRDNLDTRTAPPGAARHYGRAGSPSQSHRQIVAGPDSPTHSVYARGHLPTAHQRDRPGCAATQAHGDRPADRQTVRITAADASAVAYLWSARAAATGRLQRWQ